MKPITIERASLNAWPAFRQIDDNGWIVRFADGYTKRSNSVNILRPGSGSLENQILHYEQVYNSAGQPCIFKLLSFNNNIEIENILDSRDYTKGDHSLVLSQDLQNKEFPSLEFEPITIDGWMELYCELSNKEIKEHSTHIKMINSIKYKYLIAILPGDKNIMSCGLGVISDGLFGIFDIVTHPQYRNKGYGYKLINGMLYWAVQNLAHTSYVQVTAENTPAVRLYKKLGYDLSYEYHYKIQNLSGIRLDRYTRLRHRTYVSNKRKDDSKIIVFNFS
ncbi:MAG: GNAT family N-acetyltransferase [Desulfobacteraceae bacterium]|jgi:RimJ/RimL family protein N-acetyltransferase